MADKEPVVALAIRLSLIASGEPGTSRFRTHTRSNRCMYSITHRVILPSDVERPRLWESKDRTFPTGHGSRTIPCSVIPMHDAELTKP